MGEPKLKRTMMDRTTNTGLIIISNNSADQKSKQRFITLYIFSQVSD